MSLEYLIAILPTVVIIFVILSFDRYNREPVWLLSLLFIAGIISAFPAIILETLYSSIFGEPYTAIGLVLQAFFGVALMEEGVKYIADKLIAYNSRSYDELYDGIIYCATVSLGFATLENIAYVGKYGISTGIVRAITSVPGHAIFGVLMGYFLSLAKFVPEKRSYYSLLSIAAPVAAHGIYDAILFLNLDWALLVFVPFMIYLYVKAIKLIKETNNIPPIVNNGPYDGSYDGQNEPYDDGNMTPLG
ncbi:MAG: PrsW family intramembrane metalloprotease [Eubacteriaceae bacterium]|nr:PrsW family intramembrane metalloprotease [Eubacteriaceae bacterium]